MILRSLTIDRIRNLSDQTLSFDPAVNLFVGDNGQGKTNLLESIYFLGTTKSFRTHRLQNLVRIGEGGLYASGAVETRDLQRTISVGIDFGESRRRELQVNAGKVPLTEYLRHLPVVAYSSARLEIIRGGPDERRRFLDRGIAAIDPRYIGELATFQRVLKQRNALLARIGERAAKPSMLDAWDEEFAKAAGAVVDARRKYAARLDVAVRQVRERHDYHLRDLSMEYRPAGYDPDTDWREQLLRSRQREISAGFTLVGPHRDDLEFTHRGMGADEILSSGEVKMAVLFLKFAKIELFREVTGDAPVLVLDDIDAELDLATIRRVLNYLSRSVQLFVSSPKDTASTPLPDGPRALFSVRAGIVTPGS